MWFFGLIVVLLIGAVAVVASGRWGAMAPAYDDRPDVSVPARQALSSDDIETARFGVAVRGYRMDEVDTLLERVAREVAERDRRIADLERAVTPIMHGPEGAGFTSRSEYDPADFDDTGFQQPIMVGGNFPEPTPDPIPAPTTPTPEPPPDATAQQPPLYTTPPPAPAESTPQDLPRYAEPQQAEELPADRPAEQTPNTTHVQPEQAPDGHAVESERLDVVEPEPWFQQAPPPPPPPLSEPSSASAEATNGDAPATPADAATPAIPADPAVNGEEVEGDESGDAPRGRHSAVPDVNAVQRPAR